MFIRARSACGFSIIELLLVLAVLSIVAAFSVPALRGTMTAYRLRSSADIVVGELDAARVMAISRGAVYRVTFTGGSVSVTDPRDTAHPPRVPKQLEQGVSISGGAIQFMPRGTCSGGIIQLQNEDGIATIEVTGTGRMRVVLTGNS